MIDGSDRLRLDKWLWQARLCKSRTLAARLCEGGRLRLGGSAVSKAHQAVRVGDVLTFPQGPFIRVVRVLKLGLRRGPASEARALYEDLAPPEKDAALPTAPRTAARSRGSGRPTKAERRAIDHLRQALDGEP
jgi:ribosome-associated heat shock protein Hsp15